MHYSVFVMVPFEKEEEAERVAKLICKDASQRIEQLKTTPPKLVIGLENYEEKSYQVFPCVLVAKEEPADSEGKTLIRGQVLCDDGRFKNFELKLYP